MEGEVLQRSGDEHIQGSQRVLLRHGIPFKYSGAEDDDAILLVSGGHAQEMLDSLNLPKLSAYEAQIMYEVLTPEHTYNFLWAH